MDPNEIAQGLWHFAQQGGFLELATALRSWGVDRWQVGCSQGAYSMARTADTPPEGFEALGCWEPFGASNGTIWYRRPLRKKP